MIQKAIEKCNGNLSAVAAQLGITRQTLYNKMKNSDYDHFSCPSSLQSNFKQTLKKHQRNNK